MKPPLYPKEYDQLNGRDQVGRVRGEAQNTSRLGGTVKIAGRGDGLAEASKEESS